MDTGISGHYKHRFIDMNKEMAMTTQGASIEVMTEPDVPFKERRVDTPHGRVFVRDIPGADPPIVLMHGFPDDHRVYDKLVPWLSSRRVVIFDWLGYGRSGRSDAAPFSLEEHGSELAAVLDELDITRAVLVGHDASGPDAVAFSVVHPERVAHLVLLNTIFGNQAALQLPEMIRLLADPGLTPLADAMINDEGQRLWLLQHTADQWGLDAVDPDGLAIQSILPQFFGDASQPDALTAIRTWTAGLFDALVREDALIHSGALRRLAVPVSIIFGETDRYLNPSLAAEIADLFREPSLHLVPNASHWPQWDQPETVAELIRKATDNG
jgi:pimeloyl-ACP methyl ester carboxylesterase